MQLAIILCLFPLCLAGPSAPAERGIWSWNGCDGKCKIHEGDCDSDDDCVEGLKCDYDNSYRHDYCVAGPNTKNYQIGDWSDWSECSATECGEWGTQKRTRKCTPPEFGGYECPSEETFRYFQINGCKTKCSKAACNQDTWDKFAWDCCTKDEPCYEEEGDCDNDDECAGNLVCGKNNCPAGFTAKFGKNSPDCCEKPKSAGERGILSHDGCGERKCNQGEGDCDSNDDCVEGLVCDYDNWWGKDYCAAGPNTKNGKASEWGEWSECSATECGTTGTQTRMRSCIVPMFGGYPCPEDVDYTEDRECSAPVCTTTEAPTTPAPTIKAQAKSNPACNSATWDKFDWQCCTADEPCYVGEGDCDNDTQCAGDLVCGKDNCPFELGKQAFGRRPDCCQLP